MALVGVGGIYTLGADRGDHQCDKKDSGAESHDNDAASTTVLEDDNGARHQWGGKIADVEGNVWV